MKYAFLVLLFLLLTGLTSAQNSIPKEDQLTANVGDIAYNPQTDRLDFKLCDKGNIYWYYQLGTKYTGGKPAIVKSIFKYYRYVPAFKNISGSITISFVVNCEGQTDRFRISQLGTNYQKITFQQGLVKQLLQGVKSLDAWIPGKYHDGSAANSYYYLNFKIEDGKIKEITP